MHWTPKHNNPVSRDFQGRNNPLHYLEGKVQELESGRVPGAKCIIRKVAPGVPSGAISAALSLLRTQVTSSEPFPHLICKIQVRSGTG